MCRKSKSYNVSGLSCWTWIFVVLGVLLGIVSIILIMLTSEALESSLSFMETRKSILIKLNNHVLKGSHQSPQSPNVPSTTSISITPTPTPSTTTTTTTTSMIPSPGTTTSTGVASTPIPTPTPSVRSTTPTPTPTPRSTPTPSTLSFTPTPTPTPVPRVRPTTSPTPTPTPNPAVLVPTWAIRTDNITYGMETISTYTEPASTTRLRHSIEWRFKCLQLLYIDAFRVDLRSNWKQAYFVGTYQKVGNSTKIFATNQTGALALTYPTLGLVWDLGGEAVECSNLNNSIYKLTISVDLVGALNYAQINRIDYSRMVNATFSPQILDLGTLFINTTSNTPVASIPQRFGQPTLDFRYTS